MATHLPGVNGRTLCGAVTKHIVEKNATCIACQHGGKSPGGQRLNQGKALQEDWSNRCEICGGSPVVPETGMCGPCTFGEADTAGGNW